MGEAEVKSCRYPTSIRDQERKLIQERRAVYDDKTEPSDEPGVGVALSGGGIRSATQSLGFFQALAGKRLLRHVDFISTVSGGGYFGGFLGAWFTRGNGERPKHEEVEEALDGGKGPVGWLRNNSNYLAPNGAGDLALAVAIVLRNWLSMLVVMGTAALVFFLAARAIACFIDHPSVHAWKLAGPVLLSPYLALVLVPLVFAMGVGWAYWLVPSRRDQRKRLFAWIGAVFAALGGVAILKVGQSFTPGDSASTILIILGAILLAVAVIAIGTALFFKWFPAEQWGRRLRASRGLRFLLKIAGLIFLFSLVDSLGLTAYGLGFTKNWGWVVSAVSAMAVLAGFAQKIATKTPKSDAPSKKGKALDLTAPLAGFVVAIAIASMVSFVSHGVTWCGSAPQSMSLMSSSEARAVELSSEGYVKVVKSGDFQKSAGVPNRTLVIVLLIFAVAVSSLWWIDWPFVNRSSFHRIYHARLTRAFIGASNPKRWKEGKRVVEVDPDDDLDMEGYNACKNGAPLHLVNVTINETIEGPSQLQTLHRKGLGMAVGPVGVSVGARHHALWDERCRYLQPLSTAEELPSGHKVFSHDDFIDSDKAESLEPPLSLGQWVAISGAAASTGMGYRTTIGKSLLCGLFNVRLGFWWDSGLDRYGGGKKLIEKYEKISYVQRALLDEYLARFPGTARRHWYLSDGGHFENMGAYELIRRRIPLIIVCDFEQDLNYRFSGLGNLVRKARIDFDAEIRFLTKEELDKAVDEELRPRFGTLEELRPVEDKDEEPKALFALARVKYKDPLDASWLIYVKPVLRGDEPADVMQYKAENPHFPQQTTGDQFFDEGQWESYRCLGRHLGEQLLYSPDKDPDSKELPINWIKKGFTREWPPTEPKKPTSKKPAAKKKIAKKTVTKTTKKKVTKKATPKKKK